MNIRVVLAVVTTLVFWGSAFAGIRAVKDVYSPGHMALLRFGLASLTLIPVALVRRIPLPRRRDLPVLAAVGLCGITLYHLALNYGERTVDGGTACFIVNLSPVFTALFSMLLLRERLRLWAWLGMLISMFGILLISVARSRGFRLDLGVLAIFSCAVNAALYFVLQKPLLQRYGAVGIVCYATWLGTIFLLVFLPGLPGAVRAAPAAANWTVLYLAVFPAAFAYLTWGYVLKNLTASRAASLLYLAPMFAIASGAIWLREWPDWLSLAGGLVALAGVVVVNTLGRDGKPAKTVAGG